MKNLSGRFLILASVITVTLAQRPLNTTVNATSVHTEPFFVKPKDSNRGVPDPLYYPAYNEGYRNRERYPIPHPNADLPPLNPNDGSHANSHVPPNNRLHKVNRNRQNAFNKLREYEKNAKMQDMQMNSSYSEGSILKRPIVYPEKRVDPEKNAETTYAEGIPVGSSPTGALNRIKSAVSEPIQHTPSPPAHEDNVDQDEKQGVKCSFEKPCAWTYETNVVGTNFEVVTGIELTESNVTGVIPGPTADILKDAKGHFLHLLLNNETGTRTLKSPVFSSTREKCYLEVFLHQSSMEHGTFRIVIETLSNTKSSWVPSEILGDDERKWKHQIFEIDRISNDFRILFEIVPNGLNGAIRGHVSIDNLRLKSCFDEKPFGGQCNPSQLKCNERKIPVCFSSNQICDLVEDCDDLEDENSNCDKIPHGGLCDFEKDWCGWQNSGQAVLLWARHSGATPTDKTGPEFDHTLQHTNASGHYLFVNMNQHANDPEKKALTGFASIAVIQSVVFNPPPPCHSNITSPFRNTCNARFYIHQFGPNPGSFNISVVEMKGRENMTTTLWWSSRNLGDKWTRVEVILPNITSKYFMQVESRMGIRIYSDVAMDDFSMSPECFGYNIPAEHLGNYNYWDPRIGIYKKPYVDFVDKKFYELSTCGVRGNFGPTPEDCSKAYNGSDNMNNFRVSDKPPFKGAQIWKVPSEGYYTIIVKGAGGGLGSGGVSSSRGSIVSTVIELHKDEEIHILVGQSGENACIKSLGIQDESCASPKDNENSKEGNIRKVNELFIENGGGGGGGASFVFLLNQFNKAIPLVVAGGGAGLGLGRHIDDNIQQARGFVPEKQDFSGQIIYDNGDEVTAGPGGGWKRKQEFALDSHYGASLLEGARGGEACYSTGQIHGFGGFGGGGGGCDRSGGGGGGYAGGDSNFFNSTNGEGGSSYLGLTRSVRELSFVYPGSNSGHGSVILIPAIEGCNCDYRCVALDEYRSVTGCICPEGLRLKADNLTACEFIDEPTSNNTLVYLLVVISTVLAISLVFLFMMLYNRFQRRRQAAMRSKMLHEQDVQLARLRTTTDESGITNFNPSYGCDGILNGGSVDVKSLPQVARESLRLVKALGQGAFGEVYQGLYRHRDGDTVEMPVAVKTLPELSTGQAESDFLMEAAIMAKFNHPNIVHLIGVCFDRHPRFIVLELLAGGDLKNFLRESRNKPERPSPLTMKDLMFCALDVAKGCRYMESKRFIHRDIAARNCLLTSKGPGRVVKIADFGMARDIYRSDYYRKGGKAMLPIKWTPPEGFLDGIFTSKTDVWSFGVLLWEVFSLGLMPYTGLLNRDVMQLVAGGGRLDAPPGCPPAIYRIMGECWNPTPELRPSFTMLLDRLTACTQDPEIMNSPLPSFFRPSSVERDTKMMQPSVNEDFCLQVPNSSDYLIPLQDSRAIAERLLTEATGVTIPDTMQTYSLTNTMAMSDSNCWETSFSKPNPKPKLCSKDSMEDRLISLDTPTTIDPPQPFANSPMQNLPPSSITLDPAALKQGYANVKMENDMSKFNGGLVNGNVNNNNHNNNNNLPKDKNSSQPFSISMQGYSESHSEISC